MLDQIITLLSDVKVHSINELKLPQTDQTKLQIILAFLMRHGFIVGYKQGNDQIKYIKLTVSYKNFLKRIERL